MTEEQIRKIAELVTAARINQFFKNMQTFFDVAKIDMERTTNEIVANIKKMIEDESEQKRES